MCLSPTEIHVWLIHLDRPTREVERLVRLLAADEQQRAARFVTATLKNRFIVGRGCLREIVSYYLGCPPVALPIGYGLHGKPELPGTALQFNLSHSEGLALCAISGQRRVGIDLECERSIADLEQLARQYFSACEYTRLVDLPPEQRSQCFLEGWTAREAYLKATGEGLAGLEGLRQLALDPNRPVPGWSSCTLAPLPGFVATLVANGEGWQPRCWQWDSQTVVRTWA